MGRGKKYSAEQIVSLLRQIEVGTAMSSFFERVFRILAARPGAA